MPVKLVYATEWGRKAMREIIKARQQGSVIKLNIFLDSGMNILNFSLSAIVNIIEFFF